MPHITRNPEATPLMRQYGSFKRKYPDALLLFRVGDFYETFADDAIKASKILGITLTRRSGMELAGVPYHAIDTYLPRLVKAGLRVAICEQLEDAKLVKSGNIVRRGVTELITPGLASGNVLEQKENNFLASIHLTTNLCGIAIMDASTGEFYVAQGSSGYVDKLLANFSPKEVLYQRGKENMLAEYFGSKYYTYKMDDYAFQTEGARDKVLNHFGVHSLRGFGIEGMPLAVCAAGAILFYMELTQHNKLGHLNSIARIEEEDYVWLDRFSARNLELFESAGENAKTLLQCLDCAISPMGARLLRRWIALPLKDIKEINRRLDIVYAFAGNEELCQAISAAIRACGDLERLLSRASTARISPRETMQLARSLRQCDSIKNHLSNTDHAALLSITTNMHACAQVCMLIEEALTDEPPAAIGKGMVVRPGYSEKLDALRSINQDGDTLLKQIEQREMTRTGIPIKIDYNNVFGYYIEVRHTHKNRVPPDWIRKQTLANAERYITGDLKEFEYKKLRADEEILLLEQQMFSNLLESIEPHIAAMQRNAAAIAQADCLLGFCMLAQSRNYCRPVFTNDGNIDIIGGRHPVVEQMLPAGEPYIANDVHLDQQQQQIIILTGPNMSGKSALLRQTALIVLMAQAGCPVPARSASISVVDKIFTRVGASDNISQGESTFMVEMLEAASIINNLSKDSLILLDEIGRGTSTYDGISIACAMVEFIHEHASRAKTIFATHYHELSGMEDKWQRIKNFSITTQEVAGKVVFLRKLVSGASAQSYGIHVARMAGMPRWVCDRALEILCALETKSAHGKACEQALAADGCMQLSFFDIADPALAAVRSMLEGMDINLLTPLQALNTLAKIKRMIK
jgi:DNA mismatch repair protein MutS